MEIPSSTYRVQLHAGFTFRQLDDILNYLEDLGISSIYASPISQAVSSSQHGYDVCAPTLLNPEIGTEMDLETLHGRLKEKGMTWIQDIVPNHMAFTDKNPWLYDVLERGHSSPYYSFFDIDTSPNHEWFGDRVMAPFLGRPPADAMKEKEIVLGLGEEGFAIGYYKTRYPVAASSYAWICSVREGLPAGLIQSLSQLEACSGADISAWKNAKQTWLKKVEENAIWRSAIGQCVHAINSQPHLLMELMDKQYYALEDAGRSPTAINYRRFFTVNSLICLRMEDVKVFTAYHSKLLEWREKGLIQGLRIDHIDGLAAPRCYIDRLRESFGKDIFIVAEKITAPAEQMPGSWDLQGMTGYEFLALAGQLFTDREGFEKLRQFYVAEIAPQMASYENVVFENKYRFLKSQMGGELNNLLQLLVRSNPAPELPIDKIRMKEALAIFMCSFSVYRVYPEPDPTPDQDTHFSMNEAFEKAAKAAPGYCTELQQLKTLLKEHALLQRLAQFTGPLAAKGVEDTTFYVYNVLLSRNEVGDSPARSGMTVDEFHRAMSDRAKTLPHSLNAGTTHDTKRSEDSRIRLNFLTCIPGEWIDAVSSWRVANSPLIHRENDRLMPTPNDEYFIYQSLLGAIPPDGTISPDFLGRFHSFLTKALREGKTNTNYDTPDETYERKCHEFVDSMLAPGSPFRQSFIPFANHVIREAIPYSLSHLLLRLTAPGVPDIYQGAECWELSMVDPDNRRPVDFAQRMNLFGKLKEMERKGWPFVKRFINDNHSAGAAKIYTLYKTLIYRKRFPVLFSKGEYIPIDANDNTLAFLRRHNGSWALVVIILIRTAKNRSSPLYCKLPGNAPAFWINIFTSEVCRKTERGIEITKSMVEFPAVLFTAHG